MDWSSFGMTRIPFRSAVDTASYFPAAAHESGAAALSASLARHDHVVLVDGPTGTGKTLVARRWLEQLPPQVPRIIVPNGYAVRPADLLQAILFDLDRPYEGLTEQELRLAVTAQILTAAGSGHPLVALIDEAQHLSHAALEELRMLGNIEVGGAPALFIVLVALSALRESLNRPAYEAISQRISGRHRIEPLSVEESAAYLRHQVQSAGGDPSRVLDEEAVALLASECAGLPRILNTAAGLALELAAESGSGILDVEAALEALQRLGRAPTESQEPVTIPVVIPHAAAATGRPAAGAARGSTNANELPPSRQSKQRTVRKRSA